MKVGFILLSHPRKPIPSTRVAALNMFPLLAQQGVQCETLFAPERPSETPELPLNADAIAAQGFDVVCFQKIHGPHAEALSRALRAKGVGTVFLVCDVVDEGMCGATSITAVVTDHLRSLYPEHMQGKIHVVHDGIERPEIAKQPARAEADGLVDAVLVTSAHLTAVPVLGLPPRWLRVTIVGPYASSRLERLRQDRWTFQRLQGWRARLAFLRFLLNRRVRRRTWSPDGVYDELLCASVGIIPVDAGSEDRVDDSSAPLWQRKSENRLTLKMAVGLPVVATPIPAYLPIIEAGVNGNLARNRTEWLHALSSLRDREVREKMGAQARADVLERYSMRAQCKLLLAALNAAVREAGRSQPENCGDAAPVTHRLP